MQFELAEEGVFDALRERVLHLWLVDFVELSPDFERYQELLTSEQVERMQRFSRQESQRQYVFSHVALSCLMRKYLGESAELACVTKNKHGKPLLEGVDLAFNLSHSGECAMIGFSRGVQLGVDVEQVREKGAVLNLMDRYYSESERLWVLAGGTSEERLIRFYQIWVGKEAYLKALGVGLTMNLQDFSISWQSEPGFCIESEAGVEQWCGSGSCFDLGTSNYCSSFCVDKSILSVHSFRWCSAML